VTTKKQALPFKRRSSYLARPEDLHLEKESGQKHYDPRVHNPPVESKVRWIMRHGVQQAVAVEKCGDRVVVVDGRQRVINCLEANRRLVEKGGEPLLVPVVPKRGGELELFQISVICNEHRQAENPVAQAYKMERYMGMGHNEEDCADLWGVTPRTVLNRLYLLELCKEVQQAVIEGKITVGRAISLRNLSYAEQRKALKAKPPERKQRRPSAKKVERVLNNTGKRKLPKAARAAIEWATGVISDEEAAKAIPALAVLLDPVEDPAQQKLFA
jgi:ParB-like chromosome segregation protein Spo0J